MSKLEFDVLAFDGINTGDQYNNMPIQTLPDKQKTKAWRQGCMNSLESIGLRQLNYNIRFSSYRRMAKGQFSYEAVGLEEMQLPWFDGEVRKLRDKLSVATYLKHFDFIGIIVNALTGIYAEFEDRFVVDSRDEYATNEYIRQKTEMLHKYAAAIFTQEVNKLLLMRGINPERTDFANEEEQVQYQQQLQQQVQALTPPEIEKFMSKNFKVIATEWAQNVIENDKKRFGTTEMDSENFVDYLLSGRYFKHFHVGYDFYQIERWLPEEAFFSEDVDARYPQDGEFAGRIRHMAPSQILTRFGHLMTLKEQEGIGNYWNKSKKDYDQVNGVRSDNYSGDFKDSVFPKGYVVPHHNYFDHQVNVQMENALGVPLGKTTVKDEEGNAHEVSRWIPRYEDETYAPNFGEYLREDINVRRDTIRVVEAYWRSQKRLAVLITENELGSISVELVTDDLLDDYLKDNDISKLRTVSLEELKRALNEDKLYDYLNTITYFYTPEVWKGVKIKGNGTTVKDDIYLDVRPLDYQIKGGDSNMYDVKLPVAGIIDDSIVTKIVPYQQLHNICMNQITELLEKELGVFFTFDITGLAEEYQDQTTEEAIFRVRDIIKDAGIVGFDLSRQNTQGNNPNLFQRQEIVYATQVQYRYQLAQQYKQDALNQIGLTPQILGAPQTYTTAEGVKQGAQASYAIINPIFSKMSQAKAKEMELHISVAQYCQTNGKDQSMLFRGSDQELRFLDILAEDGEIFPLRMLNVFPSNSAKDRKVIEQVKQWIIQDNTIDKTLADTISLLTDPTIVEMKNIAQEAQKRTDRIRQEQQQAQQQQLQMQLDANAQAQELERQHEINLVDRKGYYDLREAEVRTLGQLEDNNEVSEQFLARLDKLNQDNINNDFRAQEIQVKQNEVARKDANDKSQINTKVRALELKAEELALRKEQVKSNERIALYNKN